MPGRRKRLPHLLIAVLLVLIASGRIISTYTALSHTMDEPLHLGSGMEWLRGTYVWETSHPPLARVMSAIAVHLGGGNFEPADSAMQEGLRVFGHDAHYDRMLSAARSGILPLFWMACAVVFLWARRVAGDVAAVLAILIFTAMPTVLAHAGLVTTDMAATAFCGIAALYSILWAEKPSWGRTLVLGIIAGLGVIAKFSFPVYMTGIWGLFLLWHRPPMKEIRSRLVPAACALAIGAFVIWAGYRFTLAPFWDGLYQVWKHNSDGHNSFILGHRHQIGVWYFFPVVLALKTPIALLLLLPFARGRLKMPLLFTIAILAVAMSSRINIGVRHVLPIYIGLAIIGGAAAARLLQTRARWAVAALFGWMVVSGALQHPDYIAYTNEIAGSHPENFVAESDLDWGQDMHLVGGFLRTMGAREVSFTPYNIWYLEAGHAFPKCAFSNWYHPEPGWNVVSLGGLKIYNHPGWAEDIPPQFRIGRTHVAWYFKPGQVPPGRAR